MAAHEEHEVPTRDASTQTQIQLITSAYAQTDDTILTVEDLVDTD